MNDDKNNGLFYCNNAVDTKKILVNKKDLSTNVFCLGEPGTGMGFYAKSEFIRAIEKAEISESELIVVDPLSELKKG